MKCRAYYFSLKDFEEAYNFDTSPYKATKFETLTEEIFGTLTSLPFPDDDANVEKLWQLLLAEKRNDPILKVLRKFDDTIVPTIYDLEVDNAFKEWYYKLITIIAKTYSYYNAVLKAYAGAESDLMADLKSTSENKVRFNDTPQNDGTGGIYEGENYMTNFTKTEGKSTTPLTTKINRLKEIQDQYKRSMADWLKEVGRVFLPEGE